MAKKTKEEMKAKKSIPKEIKERKHFLRKINSSKFNRYKKSVGKIWLIVFSWFKSNLNTVLTILTFLLFYSSLYSIAMVEYRTQLSIADVAKTNILNLVSSGRLDVALRSYRDASLKTLRNKPNLWNMITWYPYNCKSPNKEYLWILMRSELYRHAKNYPEQIIDLSYTDMNGVQLANCNFSFINFYKVDFRNSDLRGCDFSNSFLYRTDVRGANIELFKGSEDSLTLFIIYRNEQFGYLFEELLLDLKINNEEYKRFLFDSAQIIADNSQIDRWCKLLQSDNWKIRNNALCAIGHLGYIQKTDKVRRSLNDLLNKELSITINGDNFITKNIINIKKDEYQEKSKIPSRDYYDNLLTVVAESRDSTALSKVVWYISDPSITSERITDLFYYLGHDAISHLIEILDIGTPELKLKATKILHRLLADEIKKENIDSLVLNRIVDSYEYTLSKNKHPIDTLSEKEEVKKEYSTFYPREEPKYGEKWFENRIDTKKNIRMEILWSLRIINSTKNKELIKIIQDLAENDLYCKEDNNIYPVREAAKVTLNKLGINKE